MDEEGFSDVVARLKKANAVIAGLDESIRADAFSILRPYVEGRPLPRTPPAAAGKEQANDGQRSPIDSTDLAAFLEDRSVDRPSEAIYALTAFLFSEYGAAPFSIDELSELGSKAGLTVPKRIDKTLAASKKDNKSHFQKAGRGRWAPTVAGELWLKATYGVSKGTKRKPEADATQ